MNSRLTRGGAASFLLLLTVCVVATTVFIGLRPEHVVLFALIALLFFASTHTYRILLALLPFVLFAMSYDWMRVFPNYEFGTIDTEGLYRLEQALFGIEVGGQTLIPCQWFALHHWPLADLLAGISYLLWVPGPISFALWLFFHKDYEWCTRFTWTFLLVNLIGFAGYYVHPAAPPWYVMEYGFTPVFDTPGHVGGLVRFDQMVHLPVFKSIYAGNSNVFAAMPSLHSAYMLVTTFYAVMSRQRWWLTACCALVCIGIWFTAVYSGHHYVLDVLAGVLTACIGVMLSEWMVRRVPIINRAVCWYSKQLGGTF